MQIEQLPDYLWHTKKQSKKSTSDERGAKYPKVSNKQRLQLFQILSRELARNRENQPDFLDIIEMLESARAKKVDTFTLEEKKLMFVASHCITTVYFIAAVDAGKIKIGKTVDIEKRLATLRTMSPVDIELVCTIDYDEGLERRIHEHLKEYRANGEWFYADQPVLDFIRGYRTNGIRWVVDRVGDAHNSWMSCRDMNIADFREELYQQTRDTDPDYKPNTQNKSGVD